jgi:hypothetical protein
MSQKTFEKLIKKSNDEAEKTKLAWERFTEQLKEACGENAEDFDMLNYGDDLDDDGVIAMRVGNELFGGEMLSDFYGDSIHDKAEETKAEMRESLSKAGVGAGHPMARAAETKLRLLEKLANRKATSMISDAV